MHAKTRHNAETDNQEAVTGPLRETGKHKPAHVIVAVREEWNEQA
jgi:hypothetical protein